MTDTVHTSTPMQAPTAVASTTATGTQHVTDADFASVVTNANKPVFVDFYATWCGPCKLAAPIIDKLATEYKEKVLIVKMDVDENPQTAQKFGIMSIPTVIIVRKQGEEMKEVVQRQIGFPGEETYRRLLEQAAGN